MNQGLLNKIIRGSLVMIISMLCVACKDKDIQTVSFSERADELSSSEETYLQLASIESENTKYENDISYTDIFVYVTGQVNKPGVYQVNVNARLYEVIDLAGGFTDKASQDCINLAEKVVDGQQVNVLSKAEYKKLQSGNAGQSAEQIANSNESADGLININTATVEELMKLPGIGKSKATAIVTYREENGRYTTIEDIMKVSGIKGASFRQIKLFIKV